MGHGSRGRRRRADPLGAEFAPLTRETPSSSVREYLNAEQLSEVTPWSLSAIDKMVAGDSCSEASTTFNRSVDERSWCSSGVRSSH
jgi:hypothetical protein